VTLLDEDPNHRLIVIDDNDGIHEDFRKILSPRERAVALDRAAGALFDDPPAAAPRTAPRAYQLTHAHQGQEGFEAIRNAAATGRPFAVAFIDMRMPPGWNGLETAKHVWTVDQEIEIVICTAYSDLAWEEMCAELPHPDRLLILKKPFDSIEVRQLAYGLTAKWYLRRQAACRLQDLEIMVEERTRELEEASRKLARALEAAAPLVR
jgi:DNA-binding LytR/AlgR family response regulator